MEQTNSIYKKLGEVMSKIEAIDKGQRNTTQNFMFRGIDDFMNALHKLFAQAGIILLPSELEHIQESYKTTNSEGHESMRFRSRVHVQFTFLSTEDGSSVQADGWGEAMDNGDKSYNKCKSIALKYVLMQMFLVPTKDMVDPDKESPGVASGEDANSLDLELVLQLVKETESVDDLQQVWRDNAGMQTNKKFYQAVQNRNRELSKGQPA